MPYLVINIINKQHINIQDYFQRTISTLAWLESELKLIHLVCLLFGLFGFTWNKTQQTKKSTKAMSRAENILVNKSLASAHRNLGKWMVHTKSVLNKSLNNYTIILKYLVSLWTAANIFFLFLFLPFGPHIENTSYFCTTALSNWLNLCLTCQFKSSHLKKILLAIQNTQLVWFSSCCWVKSGLNHGLTLLKLLTGLFVTTLRLARFGLILCVHTCLHFFIFFGS